MITCQRGRQYIPAIFSSGAVIGNRIMELILYITGFVLKYIKTWTKNFLIKNHFWPKMAQKRIFWRKNGEKILKNRKNF